jgi:hypothetical protein
VVTDDLHDLHDDDGRIRHEDIVSFLPPAFLTMDYDPTHRPSLVPRTAPYTVTDPDALAIAEQMIAAGVWRQCPDCDHYITTGLAVHWECSERRRKAAEAHQAAAALLGADEVPAETTTIVELLGVAEAVAAMAKRMHARGWPGPMRRDGTYPDAVLLGADEVAS